MSTNVERNWLLRQAWDYLRWSISIYKKLGAIVPGYTILSVTASLTSQICMLLAFVLPLKIVLLIASPGVPRYFPAFFADLDRDRLAISLGIAAAGFYIVYLLAERTIAACGERGAGLLLERSHKLALFANQEEVAKQAYQRFTGSVASLLFAGLAMLVISLIYWPLAGFLVALLSLVLLGTCIASENIGNREWIAAHVSGMTQVLAAIFFLSAFAFILVDFIWRDGVNIIVAIVSLLLTRQLAQRLSLSITDAITLSQQKARVNALFFHGKAFSRTEAGERLKGFWSLLEKEKRKQWLQDLLQEVVGSPLVRVDSWWHQTGPPGVVGLDVSVWSEDADNPHEFFVKLYDERQRAQGIHEATLMGEMHAETLGAPTLVTTVTVESYQCLIYQKVPHEKPEPKFVKELSHDLMLRSWSVEPPAQLVNRYCRSKPLLVDRLDEQLLHRLQIASSTPQQEECVAEFESRLKEIKDLLFRLPLFVYNPSINATMLRIGTEGKAVATHWGRWSLEPIGAGLPVVAQELEAMSDHLYAASKGSSRLASLSPHHVRLAALIFAVERNCSREEYSAALELLPDVLKSLDAGMESVEPDRKELAACRT